MEMMNIILIRHGQSQGNKKGEVQGQTCEGLTDLGFRQAEKVAEQFNLGDLDAIYSSDSTRAVQTATPTAKKLNLDISTTPKLREAAFGKWEKMLYQDVKSQYEKEYNAWHENYFERPEWFESFESHHKRVKETIEDILNTHPHGSRIAVFTHGGSKKTQIGYFKKLTGKELHEFNQPNCAFAEIEFEKDLKYENGNMLYYCKDVIKALEC